MAARKAATLKISDPEKGRTIIPDRDSIKHELAGAAVAVESLCIISTRDVRRMAKEGMEASVKLCITSHDYLPKLCKIIHPGLTFEELRLISGTNEDELRAALRKHKIRKTTDIVLVAASREDWINIKFIVRTDDKGVESPEVLTDSETFLAAGLVNRSSSALRSIRSRSQICSSC